VVVVVVVFVVVVVVVRRQLASRCRGRQSHNHPLGWRKLSVYGTSQAKVQFWYRKIVEETLTDFDWEGQEPDMLRAGGMDDANAVPKDCTAGSSGEFASRGRCRNDRE